MRDRQLGPYRLAGITRPYAPLLAERFHFTMLSLGAEPAPEVVAYDTTMSTVLLEDLEDMAVHAKIFEALRSAALTTGQSLAFIRQTLKDIPADKDAKEAE
ncbi:Scr1 family TA system antitoxin-like transcriptional regulator [Streptomyces sp. NPDC056987]|uniref:Scr1 family TA system antitoxin-like transcriptional regulator n=1 Tax=Streptomyces sp. NPDC056987 TaxID=3345988 RepID=UPI00362A30B8